MAALLAADIAVPAGFWFAGITALPLAFIGAGTVFLPAFVFMRVRQNLNDEKSRRLFEVLPKLIRYAMKADTEAVLDAFGKNEHTKKVFWLSKVKDPRQEKKT